MSKRIACKYWQTDTGQITRDGKIVPNSGKLLGWVVMEVDGRGYPVTHPAGPMTESEAKRMTK